VEFLKTIRINFCGFDGDSADALIELQSSKNTTGARVCKDRRMTLRLIIITSFLCVLAVIRMLSANSPKKELMRFIRPNL
jgi:hypothetical protein